MSRRFLLSLVVGLSLSALASANSANVNMTFLHSGTSLYGSAHIYMDHFSVAGGKTSPAIFDASNNHVSIGESRSGYPSGLLSGTGMYGQRVTDYKTGSTASPGGMHPTRFGTDNWAGAGNGMSTPEPASLMLLSTGLIGIAGLMRRKMRA